MIGVRVCWAVASLGLVACGGPAAAGPATVTVPPASAQQAPAALPRAPEAAALGAVAHVLEDAGHACHMKGSTLVCDETKQNIATVGVVYATEPTLGPYLGWVASFNWKEDTGCANATKKLNELNSKFDLLRSSCTSDNLVFALTVPLGEHGLTAADVRGVTTYFQSLVSAVLRSSDLVGSLK